MLTNKLEAEMNRSCLLIASLVLAFHASGITASQAESKKDQLHFLKPHVAAPDQHILRFENSHVRVYEVVIPPAGKAPLHLHDLASVFITLSPARLRIRNADGFVIRDTSRSQFPTGSAADVRWLGSRSAPRSVENIDNETFHGFRIEFKVLQGK